MRIFRVPLWGHIELGTNHPSEPRLADVANIVDAAIEPGSPQPADTLAQFQRLTGMELFYGSHRKGGSVKVRDAGNPVENGAEVWPR